MGTPSIRFLRTLTLRDRNLVGNRTNICELSHDRWCTSSFRNVDISHSRRVFAGVLTDESILSTRYWGNTIFPVEGLRIRRLFPCKYFSAWHQGRIGLSGEVLLSSSTSEGSLPRFQGQS